MAMNNNNVLMPRSLGGFLSDQPLFSLDFSFQLLIQTSLPVMGQSSVHPIAPPSRAYLLIPFHVATDLGACMLYLVDHLPRTCHCLTTPEFLELVRDTASRVTRVARIRDFSEFRVRVEATVVASTVSMEDTLIVEEVFVGEPRDRTGASSTALARLKKNRFCFDSDMGTETETCVVCLEELSGEAFLTRMPCSHIFHESCIFEWLKKANSCPLCRCELADD